MLVDCGDLTLPRPLFAEEDGELYKAEECDLDCSSSSRPSRSPDSELQDDEELCGEESSTSTTTTSTATGGSASAAPGEPEPGHHHHHHQQQQPQPPGCMVCSSCGCSGNCGSSGMTVSYANYFQHPFSGPSMFTFPFLPFNPLCSNGYINTQQYNSSTTFPVVHTAYNSGIAPDSVMAGQSTFAVPPMQNFMAGTAGVYQAQGMMGNSNGSSHKKNGNLSCYNCGASGHRAQDCKQPPMDFNRQGNGGRRGWHGAQLPCRWCRCRILLQFAPACIKKPW